VLSGTSNVTVLLVLLLLLLRMPCRASVHTRMPDGTALHFCQMRAIEMLAFHFRSFLACKARQAEQQDDDVREQHSKRPKSAARSSHSTCTAAHTQDRRRTADDDFEHA
jgi:hypothetical protein